MARMNFASFLRRRFGVRSTPKGTGGSAALAMGSTAAFGAEERLRQRTLEAAGPYAVPGDSAERLAAEARPTSAHPWRARLAVIAVLGVAVYSILSYWNVAAPVVPIWDGWFWIAQGKSLAEGGVSRLLH